MLKKSLILSRILALTGLAFLTMHAAEEGEGGTAEDAKPEARKTRKITMDDGREVEFGEKTRMLKDYGIEGDNVWARIDFENGKVVKVYALAGNLPSMIAAGEVEGASEEAKKDADLARTALQLMGHGMVQKLGDSAAGAESTNDALEAVLEVGGRISKGQFNKVREGGGSAKGAGELVQAMFEYLSKDKPELTKDTVRELLSGLTAQEKAGLRKVAEVAEIIERLRAERKPSEGEQKKVAAAAALLAGLKEGKLPERPAADAEQTAEAPAA
jgi:hypothetical protein